MSVAGAWLRTLKAHGIDWVFSNAGTDFAPVIEALAQAEAHDPESTPRMVPILHELVAVGMATGYHLVTGKPQAAMVHVNVGTANALVGLMNAQRDGIPLLLAAGRTPLTQSERYGARTTRVHWGQEMFDQGGIVREFVKWDYELRAGETVCDLTARALGIATSETPGPVYLSLPREVLAEPYTGDVPAPGVQTPTASPPHPDPAAISTIANRIANAERPVIVAPRGSEGIFEALGAFADRYAIPVVQTRPGRLSIASDHPLHAGGDPDPYVSDADVIVTLDAVVPWIPQYLDAPDDAFMVDIASDPLFSTIPNRTFRCDVSLTARPDIALEALDETLKQLGVAEARATEERRRRLVPQIAEKRAKVLDAARDSASQEPISVAYASYCISELAEDSIIVSEFGADSSVMTFRSWDGYFGAPAAGGLGWGLTAAVGMKLARPDRLVIATVGDGSYVFANPSACHHAAAALGLGLLTVVFDNGQWNAVRRAAKGMYPDGEATSTETMPLVETGPEPDYKQLMEAYGGHGEVVTDPARLPAALEEAREVTLTGRQALVAIRCGTERPDITQGPR